MLKEKDMNKIKIFLFISLRNIWEKRLGLREIHFLLQRNEEIPLKLKW